MINLSSRSFWVRLAYTMTDEWNIPSQTNICTLFWRAVRNLAIEIVLAVIIGVALSWLSVTIYMYRRETLEVAMIVGSVVIIMGIALWIIERSKDAKDFICDVVDMASDTVPVQAFKSWKEKHCALVRIEHPED